MSLYIDNKFIRLISSRLRNFKQKKDDLYNFSCPFCLDSKKNKIKARGYVFKINNDLFYKCHNCSISTNLSTLIEHVDPFLYKEYILEKYSENNSNTKSYKSIQNIESQRFAKIQKINYDYSEWVSELDETHICKEYVNSRKIPVEFHDKLLYTSNYKKFVDNLYPEHGKSLSEDERLVIPYYDSYGKLIAITGRALTVTNEKLRYVTLRTDNSKEKLIYGLERLKKNKPIIIVEGQIDSLFLDNCIASGDAALHIVAKELVKKGYQKENIILINDNENRNKEVVRMIGKGIEAGFKTVIWPDSIKEKDINDMVLKGYDIKKLISENTYSVTQAFIFLTFWKRV